MQNSKQLILLHSDKHDWLLQLDRLLGQIESQQNICGDTLLECSKSFLEAIAKNVILKLNPNERVKEINLLDLGKLFKKAKESLINYKEIEKVMPMSDVENYFSALNQWIRFMGEMRNNIGEISHGKILPKQYSLDLEFSIIINQITDGFAYILISLLIQIDISYRQLYQYLEYIEFNEYLDDNYNLPNNLSYSKALYDQDYDAYSEYLDNYLDEIESNNADNSDLT